MLRVRTLSQIVEPELLNQLTDEALSRLTADLAAAARSFWIGLAGRSLTSSRRDYVRGIQEVEAGDGYASVSLLGLVPNLVENGQSPYDMHTTLLGPNVPLAGPGRAGKRQAADGHYYRAIPFRHQTPGTIGQGGGTPMGRAYEGHHAVGDAAALGKAVHAQAKKLAPTTGSPGGPTAWGGRLPAGLAPKLREHHTTDIYAGMVRQQKTYAKATQNTYTTFRMISEAVPEKWMHPGIEARNLAADVEKHIDEIAGKALVALLKPL